MKGLKYIVLLANAVIFALLAWLLPLGFEENDDVMMAMIANGTYSGTPDYHLVYINALYGMVLAGLYTWTKAIEWYTLSFAVLHVLSMSVLSYCLLTIPNRARWERIVWLVILYVLWARIIVAMQFTTTAGLVCLAGCVLLLRPSAKARWTGAGMVIIAALVRFLAAGLVGLLMAPIIVYTYRLEWRKYIAVVVMLAAVVGCRLTNQYMYDRDPEWKYYRAYNLLRAQLNDNPNAYRLQPNQLPENVNWMDYQLLLRFVPDGEQIDLPAIRQLSAVAGTVPLKEQWKNVHRGSEYFDGAVGADDFDDGQQDEICLPHPLHALCGGTAGACESGRIPQKPRVPLHADAAVGDGFYLTAEHHGTQTPVGNRLGDRCAERVVLLPDSARSHCRES